MTGMSRAWLTLQACSWVKTCNGLFATVDSGLQTPATSSQLRLASREGRDLIGRHRGDRVTGRSRDVLNVAIFMNGFAVFICVEIDC
jgi:hypothetical protein